MKLKHALIMAAGRGTRLRPMTDNLPKPMIKFGDYTLIEAGIKKIVDQIQHIHITVGYKGSILAEHVIGLGVHTVFNTEGHGNAWWIYNTLIRELNEPVIVLTADNVTLLDFDLLGEEYERLKMPACMVVPVVPVRGLDGDYIHHTNNLVVELSRTKPSDTYCSGIQIINPKKINELTNPCEDFYSVWEQLKGHSQLYSSSVYPKSWFTVDTIEQLERLNRERP